LEKAEALSDRAIHRRENQGFEDAVDPREVLRDALRAQSAILKLGKSHRWEKEEIVP
jgi:hypothetical protein